MSHNYSLSPSRYLAAAAIAPLCISLVACSNDADTSAEPEFSDATAASSSAEETSSEETTSEPATSEAEDTATETAEAEPTSAEAAPAEDTAESGNEEGEASAAIPAETGRGDCSPEALQPAAPTMTNIRVNNCDGQWAHFGKDSTDWTAWARYEGGQWVAIESIGTATSGMAAPCYDVDKWAAEGAPAFVTEKMRRCD
ncbi:hypothetical protein [Corynebacterium tuberculostearicum]|uniref:hypothetical protein n=1 Tax=Corynebacterium tuberculostearicum TaxID=38304 RepID=UPI002934EDC0|nr:hypothetical protein [Corynebacterium tuberculostearicum]MDV2436158.1 hypothetical protein [Corynebacterium tuberculostearicum]